MLRKSLVIAGLSTVLASGVVSPAVAAPQDFVGTWENTNSRTGGITRFIVSSRGRNLNIQVFGKCTPSDCNWGSTRLITYGSSVSDSNHLAATANYNQSFANTVLTLMLSGRQRDRISLQSFTQFTDRSNRENYLSQETFKRAANGARKPDLSVQISGLSTARAGDNIGSSLRLETKNTSRATAPGTTGRVNPDNGYMIDLVLSTDQRVPDGFANYSPNFSEDVLLQGGRISRTVDLAPGATRIYSREIASSGRIPRDTPTGRYWVCARIDPGKKVAESNEGNNVDCTQIQIRGTDASLSTPTQLSPADEAVFSRFPRTTTLRWSPVRGAASYSVEVDCYHCCRSNRWCTDVGRTWKVAENITNTRYTFDFVGAQPGRWRVWAVDNNGNASPKSEWRTFRYTR